MNSRTTIGVLLLATLIGVLGCLEAERAQPPRPVGQVDLLSRTGCDGVECIELRVSCPDLAEGMEATLLHRPPPKGPGQGTAVFFSGSWGTLFYDRAYLKTGQSVIEMLQLADFRVVEVAWKDRWFRGRAGEEEGLNALGCRPATVLRWIYRELHQGGAQRAFCATGNSNGASQVALSLSVYGLGDILDMVAFTAGPTFGRVDWGCFPDASPRPEAVYSPPGQATIDETYGAPPGQGPCTQRDPAYEQLMRADSLAASRRAEYYPRTRIAFLYGSADTTYAPAQGRSYYERLVANGSPFVSLEEVPGPGHGFPADYAGSVALSQALLRQCRVDAD